jgi:hypothetical protein
MRMFRCKLFFISSWNRRVGSTWVAPALKCRTVRMHTRWASLPCLAVIASHRVNVVCYLAYIM